jgi:hypothetical protein
VQLAAYSAKALPQYPGLPGLGSTRLIVILKGEVMAAQVSLPTTCINLQAGGTCCLREAPCPHAGKITDCGEARLGVRVQLAPDDFIILTDTAGKPSTGKFPLRRCRVTSVEEAAGVHTSSLLSSRGDAALLDSMELPNGSVMLTSRDGQYSIIWQDGKYLPG